jgi:hypothetical protein
MMHFADARFEARDSALPSRRRAMTRSIGRTLGPVE